MNERRGPWYLLTGLVIGLLIGLLFTWVINPTRLIDTSPDRLAPAFKDHYRSMIALAYESNGDLGRARGRLGLLKEENSAAELSAQAQRILAQGGSPQEARALAELASAMGVQVPSVPVEPAAIGERAATAPPEQNSTVVPTQAVTLTPDANPNAAFSLKKRDPLCDAALPEGLLQVDVIDAGGLPVAGVRITMRWAGGEEIFATGLNPAISQGYADYVMQSGVQYSLQVGTGELVSDLSTQSCPAASGRTFEGGWRLLFVEDSG
jgi:hypothetical protein